MRRAPKDPATAIHAGLWIDHRKAVIVTIQGTTETLQTVLSDVERHARSSGGSGGPVGHGTTGGSGEDTRERRFEGELDKYYEEVAGRVRDAESLWIFGPGEAKGELRKRLEHEGAGHRIAGVESADKMTDHQVAARVRELVTA
jgi:hypothetical protein